MNIPGGFSFNREKRTHENASYFFSLSYFCAFPNCRRRYSNAAHVRKHCREKHGKWLKDVDAALRQQGKRDASSYCVVVPEGQQPPWSDEPAHDDPPKKRRAAFSERQLSRMEAAFAVNRMPSMEDRLALSAEVDVPEYTLRVWFQNRRTRTADAKAAAVEVTAEAAAESSAAFEETPLDDTVEVRRRAENLGRSTGTNQAGALHALTSTFDNGTWTTTVYSYDPNAEEDDDDDDDDYD